MEAQTWTGTTDETTECRGCEHCDGEGGHSVADSKRAYAASEHYLANKSKIDAEEDAREARKTALEESECIDGVLTDGAIAKRFLLAGNARTTFVSKATGTRFTYRVRAKEVEAGKDSVHFVSVLTGSNNDADYSFFGTIFAGKRFVHGQKSRIGKDASSARAFAWAIERLLREVVPSTLEVHHEGRCGRCGRALTVPESIACELGPTYQRR